jgi:hypothetical protein
MTTSRILCCNPSLEAMATAYESAKIWPTYPFSIYSETKAKIEVSSLNYDLEDKRD